MKTISEYHVIKFFDESNRKIYHIIKNEVGEIIYEMSFKISSKITPLSPIDYMEESLDGKDIFVAHNNSQELQEIALKLHLLNTYESSSRKKNQNLLNLKRLIKQLKSLFT